MSNTQDKAFGSLTLYGPNERGYKEIINRVKLPPEAYGCLK